MRDRSIADLKASLTWDIDDFERGTADIDIGLKNLLGRARDLGERFRTVGRDITKYFTVPLTAAGAGLAAMAKGAADDLKAMGNAARLAGEDFDRFQQQAHAARSVGVEYEKLGDIFKDTRDKVGDFLATGQGELADFFENIAPKVGVTAEMFKELSGKDALQLYFNSLRQANVSSAEMVFYLESIADEASGLTPLLEANGAEFRKLGEEAQVFTPDQVASLLEYKEALREIGIAFKRVIAAAVDAGLIDMLTKLTEKIVSWIEHLAETNPALLRFAAGVAVAVAAIGPLITVFTTLAVVILPLFLARLGPVFLALSVIINPIGTLAVLLARMVRQFVSFTRVSGGALGALSRLIALVVRLNPVTSALSAIFLLFGDNVVDALGRVWERAKEVLGPAFNQLLDAVSRAIDMVSEAFTRLANSEFGQFIGEIMEQLGRLIEVLVEIGGSAVVTAFGIVINLISTMVDYFTDAVRIIDLLLRGEWGAAWDAAGEAVDRAVANMVGRLQLLVDWLHDALALLGILEKRERQGAAGGAALDNLENNSIDEIISASGVAYNGPQAGDPYELPEDEKGGRKRKTGPTAEELAERREELAFEHELQKAREADDIERIRALERQAELKARIEAYEDAGLENADARLKAEQELVELDEVRRIARNEALTSDQLQLQLQEARLRNDHEGVRSLEQELFLEEEIEDLRRRGLDAAKAEEIAVERLLRLEDARADAIAQRIEEQERSRQIELARLRGDDPEQMRFLEENDRIARRIEDLVRNDDLSRAEAEEQALREASDRSRAYLQGNFRDAFRGGLQSALDGDLKGFFKRWMEDASFNALSRVLDRLADSLADLVFNNSGGGGLFDIIGGVLGLGGGSGGSLPSTPSSGQPGSLPALDSGGSFRIRGLAGIDRNILSLNGSPVARVSAGEIMDVRKGSSAYGSGRTNERPRVDLYVHPSGEFDTRVEGVSANVVRQSAPQIVQAAVGETLRQLSRPKL
ncbi:hypothetical protein [Erythrobacter rubeus]|uniref:Phage tail tape measure protein n=1 Tax=Erythrobacter rubeus TaxID=2760803 RepID=A0ABR8KPW7_9SPHN|nr:hypothetical protein [Erythrobacter rubeus]MBD2842710.1 hypothetical protein [Erythrobacter rubeus]